MLRLFMVFMAMVGSLLGFGPSFQGITHPSFTPRQACSDQLGDVDLDGFISSYDASLILQYVVGLINLTPEEICRGDVDQSGDAESYDASLVLQCVVGLCSGLPSPFGTLCLNGGYCWGCPVQPCGTAHLLGYYQQVQNGGWEGYINAGFSAQVENMALTYWNPLGLSIVYITPSNYVIMLSHGADFTQNPIPLTDGGNFSFTYQITYVDSNNNPVLDATYTCNGSFYCPNYMTGTYDVTVTALDPDYIDFAGDYHWSFEAGTLGNVVYGYYQQVQNGDWEGYINSPMTVEKTNMSLTSWEPNGHGIVYITPANYVIMVSHNILFDPPIPLWNGAPTDFTHSMTYQDTGGNDVLQADWTNQGIFSCPTYFSGNYDGLFTALDPDYIYFAGHYYWIYQGGVQPPLVLEKTK